MARAATIWEEGHERGPRVATLAVALCLSTVVVDIALQGHLGLLFDLAFAAVCILAALQVRLEDSFVVGVLPPLLMVGLVILLSLVHRTAVGDAGDGFIQGIMTGLGRHAVALFAGYALCLLALLQRRRIATMHHSSN